MKSLSAQRFSKLWSHGDEISSLGNPQGASPCLCYGSRRWGFDDNAPRCRTDTGPWNADEFVSSIARCDRRPGHCRICILYRTIRKLRAELVHSEAQLNLARHGKLATTHLGRRVLLDTIREATLSGVSSFMSALLPLTSALAFPTVPLFSIVVSLLALGTIGIVLDNAVGGSPVMWAINLIAGGILMTVAGFWLHLV